MTRQNLAGKAMTVRGPIDPEELGITIMHEHLFVAVLKKVAPNENTSVTDFVLWDQKLTLENLHLARAEKPMADNWVLSDLRVAIEEAMEFRMMGGGTMVELTNHGLRRDPIGLLKVSNATGLNIVMGSGWYQKLYHPADMGRRTVKESLRRDNQGHHGGRRQHGHTVGHHRRGRRRRGAHRTQRDQEH